MYLVISIFLIQKFCKWLVVISDRDVCSLKIVVPFGDSIIDSIGLLLSGTPLSLGFQKSVRQEGTWKFHAIIFLC